MNDGSLREYVESSLLPLMGIKGRPFELHPAGPGTRTAPTLIRIEGMPPLLLRAFPRRRQAVKNAEALRHLDALGLPAPRLVAHDLSVPARLVGASSTRPFITVETWIEGTTHADLPEPEPARTAALDVARLLARFHAVTRPRWGRPEGSRFRPFPSHTLLGVRRMCRALERHGWIDPEEARAAGARFESWRDTLCGIETYSLVHNDANRRNFVVGPQGEIVAVDLHRVAYEPFAEELVNALYHFGRKDEALASSFQEAYFEVAGPEALRWFGAMRRFFEPLNYLKKMYRRAVSGKTLGSEDEKMAAWRRVALSIGSPSA
ncbi:MAG TPA: aminoglycoside phosphotransferase family protein [Candidatus Polarisedimenticolia bacterium]|nr:aminoglycoside phosphotransferase family protein [Candidatus Polarisedimenticolia bacterium]